LTVLSLQVQTWLTLHGKTFFVCFYILYVTFGDGGHHSHMLSNYLFQNSYFAAITVKSKAWGVC